MALRLKGSRVTLRSGCLAIFAFLVLATVALMAQQVWVWNSAKELKSDLETGQLSDLTKATEVIALTLADLLAV